MVSLLSTHTAAQTSIEKVSLSLAQAAAQRSTEPLTADAASEPVVSSLTADAAPSDALLRGQQKALDTVQAAFEAADRTLAEVGSLTERQQAITLQLRDTALTPMEKAFLYKEQADIGASIDAALEAATIGDTPLFDLTKLNHRTLANRLWNPEQGMDQFFSTQLQDTLAQLISGQFDLQA